jgi:hypothetical protein
MLPLTRLYAVITQTTIWTNKTVKTSNLRVYVLVTIQSLLKPETDTLTYFVHIISSFQYSFCSNRFTSSITEQNHGWEMYFENISAQFGVHISTQSTRLKKNIHLILETCSAWGININYMLRSTLFKFLITNENVPNVRNESYILYFWRCHTLDTLNSALLINKHSIHMHLLAVNWYFFKLARSQTISWTNSQYLGFTVHCYFTQWKEVNYI